MGSRAVDGKEMYKDLGLTYSKGKSRGGGGGLGKAFQHTEREKSKQRNKQFCNVTGDTQITSDLGIVRVDTLTWRYPKH